MEELIKFVSEYCRLDSDMSNSELSPYICASIEYVENATGLFLDDMTDNFLYKLAVAMLVSHWYENRAITTTENNTSLKQSLTYIFMQLKHCYGEE